MVIPKLVDRLKFAVTVASAGVFNAGAAVAFHRNIPKATSDGDMTGTDANVSLGVDDGAGNWELSLFNVSGSTITRAQLLRSSAGSVPPTYTGGAIIAYSDVSASLFSRVAIDSDATPSPTIPLTHPGTVYMDPVTISGNLTLSPAAGAVKGAYCQRSITGDGVSTVAVSSFYEIGGSAGYDPRNGIENVFLGWYDGTKYRCTWSQDLNAVPVDTTAPTIAGAISASNITMSAFTMSWPAASDNVAVTGYETSDDGGTTWADAGNVLAKTYSGLAASTAYPTRVRAYDQAGNRSNVLSLTITTAATADTTAPTMSGSLVPSNVTSSGFVLTWTAGADNVGVTGYETSDDGGASWTDVGNVLTKTYSGLAPSTTYPSDVRAYDAAGNRSSPLAVSVTTSSGVSYPQLTSLVAAAQSGTGPYSYTGDGTGNLSSPGGGVTAKSLPANTDGYLEFTITSDAASAEIIIGWITSNVFGDWHNIKFGFYGPGQGTALPTNYRYVQSGNNNGTLSGLGPSPGDKIRVDRVGTVLKTQLARSGAPTSFADLDTFDYGSAPQMWVQVIIDGTSAVQLTGSSGFV